MRRNAFYVGMSVLSLWFAQAAFAAINIPGADGSDGELVITNVNKTIDLGLAAEGPNIKWDTPSPVAGQGVYDPEKWAVVYKYSRVSLTGSNNLYFINHPTTAPVVWLVSGDVTINSNFTIHLEGQNYFTDGVFAFPGPGGFLGARGNGNNTLGSAGFGPGGGNILPDGLSGNGGTYATQGTLVAGAPATPTYGNWMILPLVGGSGGGASSRYGQYGGGAGGGAILIAATGTVTINGSIVANGGNGNANEAAGSGGAIRVVADLVAGSGRLYAKGGTGRAGGAGRICLQTNRNFFQSTGDPVAAVQSPIAEPLFIWPPETAPIIKPISLIVDGKTLVVPNDPKANIFTTNADVKFVAQNSKAILNIAAHNVPLDWPVVVRVTPRIGPAIIVNAAPLQGTLESSTTTAELDLARGNGAITIRAYNPN